MGAKKNQLAVIDQNTHLIPTAEDMAAIQEELQDIDRVPFGRIRIAGGGANVFKVTDPGDDDAHTETEIVGVVILSHKCNAYWPAKYGSDDDASKKPDCASMDGKIGIVAETGECRDCDACPFNQFNSAPDGGAGKACKNMRRLYLMRDGDILPMVLSLPATALKSYDNYRTRLLSQQHKTAVGVVTKITLKTAKSSKGVEYSTPIFEPDAILPAAEVERVRAFAAQFEVAAKRAGITEDEVSEPPYVPSRPCPTNANDGPNEYDFPPAEGEDGELPFGN